MKKERKNFCLLNVFDPFIILINVLGKLLPITVVEQAILVLTTVFAYIILRMFLKFKATRWLNYRFEQSNVIKTILMPSLRRYFYWDFVIQSQDNYILGHIRLLFPIIEIKAILPKQEYSDLTREAQKTQLGEFFTTFTPYAYYCEESNTNTPTVNIYDLRYFINQDFVHSATIIFSKNLAPSETYMRSYGHIFKIPCINVS